MLTLSRQTNSALLPFLWATVGSHEPIGEPSTSSDNDSHAQFSFFQSWVGAGSMSEDSKAKIEQETNYEQILLELTRDGEEQFEYSLYSRFGLKLKIVKKFFIAHGRKSQTAWSAITEMPGAIFSNPQFKEKWSKFLNEIGIDVECCGYLQLTAESWYLDDIKRLTGPMSEYEAENPSKRWFRNFEGLIPYGFPTHFVKQPYSMMLVETIHTIKEVMSDALKTIPDIYFPLLQYLEKSDSSSNISEDKRKAEWLPIIEAYAEQLKQSNPKIKMSDAQKECLQKTKELNLKTKQGSIIDADNIRKMEYWKTWK